VEQEVAQDSAAKGTIDMPGTHHKVWRRPSAFRGGGKGCWGVLLQWALTLTRTSPCAARTDDPRQPSNAPNTRGVFKQKFEQNDGRKENET